MVRTKNQVLAPKRDPKKKNTKMATALYALHFPPAFSNKQTTTAGPETLEQRLNAKYAAVPTGVGEEPPPPAEGPEDIPADAPQDVNRNPTLVPTPLLRVSAASSTP